MRLLTPLIGGLSLLICLQLRAEPQGSEELQRGAVIRRTIDGIGLLNRLYWSPTLGIWLDRKGDDLRAHYEGRLNPPWWSSANAVEVLIDFMNATGTHDFDASIGELYELHKDRHSTGPRLVAELKRRHQWSDADEQKWQRHQAEATAREAKVGESGPSGGDSYTQFRNEYLDDSGWWAIAWLKMYDRTHEAKYLETAKIIHAHMAKNWRPDKDGGVIWCEDADKQRPNSITNSLFLILSARLYQHTHSPEYLKWAGQTLEWIHSKRLFDGSGVVDAPGHRGDYWTYNQGALIGGLTALYEATGKPEYLDEAVQVADGVLSRAGLILPDGVLFEKLGTKGWDPGLFKGIMVRYLGQLHEVLNARKLHPELAQKIAACIRCSAASLLKNSVAEDGEFSVSWQEGAKDRTANFNTQTAALAALVAVLAEKQN